MKHQRLPLDRVSSSVLGLNHRGSAIQEKCRRSFSIGMIPFGFAMFLDLGRDIRYFIFVNLRCGIQSWSKFRVTETPGNTVK